MAGEDIKKGSLRAAFGSWWVIIGIIASSITSFRLLLGVTHIHLAYVAAYIVAQYHALVHIPVWWIFHWVHLPKPSEWLIDAVALWLLIGAVILRSAYTIRSGVNKNALCSISVSAPRSWNHTLGGRWTLPVFLIVCGGFWPLALWLLVATPIVVETPRHGIVLLSVRDVPNRKRRWVSSGRRSDGSYVYDMRVVLVMQTAAVVFSASLWVAWNALETIYGG